MHTHTRMCTLTQYLKASNVIDKTYEDGVLLLTPSGNSAAFSVAVAQAILRRVGYSNDAPFPYPNDRSKGNPIYTGDRPIRNSIEVKITDVQGNSNADQVRLYAQLRRDNTKPELGLDGLERSKW